MPAHGTAGPRGSVRACPAPDEGTHFVSRLWSRFGVRTAAIALLSVGVAGGVFLGEDRETQQEGIKAHQAAEIADQEIQLQREREFDQTILMAEKQEMREQARLRAAKIAKEEAERTRKAEAAAAARKQRVAEEKAAAKAAEEAKKKAAKPYDGPIPESCNEYSGNRRTGCALMIDYGFGIDQFPCLEKLWTKESGWNHQAEQLLLRRVRHPAGVARQQDGLGRRRLAEQPRHPDQVGPRATSRAGTTRPAAHGTTS